MSRVQPVRDKTPLWLEQCSCHFGGHMSLQRAKYAFERFTMEMYFIQIKKRRFSRIMYVENGATACLMASEINVLNTISIIIQYMDRTTYMECQHYFICFMIIT